MQETTKGIIQRCATLADCRLQTGRLYIVLPIRIYAIYTYTSIYTYTYTYTYIPIPIRSASLANRSSSLANPSASLQVCSLQVSHTDNSTARLVLPDLLIKKCAYQTSLYKTKLIARLVLRQKGKIYWPIFQPAELVFFSQYRT